MSDRGTPGARLRTAVLSLKAAHLPLFVIGGGLLWAMLEQHAPAAPLRMLLALFGGVVLVGSAQAHELAHRTAAARLGQRVTLQPLFAPASPSTSIISESRPRAELLIAAAGPLASLALGGGLVLMAGAVSALPPRAEGSVEAAAAPFAALLSWVGGFSLVIGAINLVPAFPLDGARMLRAVLRVRVSTIYEATDHVARVGAALGWIAGLTGGFVLLAADPRQPAPGMVAGVSSMVIGWLLLLSAVRAADQAAIEKLMSTTPVRCAARRMLPPITPDTTIEDLVRNRTLIFDRTVVPVVQQGMLLGIVAPSGLREAVGLDWMRTSVQVIMTPLESALQTDPRVSLLQAWVALEGSGSQQVAVVEHGALVGILHRDDIIDWVMEHREPD